MPCFALLGKKLGHSWSKLWFTQKFEQNNWLNFEYINLESDHIEDIRTLVRQHQLSGFNITIPYKQSIISFLDGLSPEAQKIGAVNTVKVLADGRLIGYNTDVVGFEKSITPLLLPHHKKALIFGTGGASLAVKYVLQKLNISFQMVSRYPDVVNSLAYSSLSRSLISDHTLLINTTPLGMFPNEDSCPDLPYEGIRSDHLVFDLVYNPKETLFLKKAHLQGAAIKNGEEMLHLQAERALEIWTKEG